MSNTLKLLISMSASGSIIGIALFAIKPITKRLFSKSWQYYIWLIVVFRLLIPYSPQVNIMDTIHMSIDSLPLPMNIEDTIENENNVMQLDGNGQEILKREDYQAPMDLIKLVSNNLFLIWFFIASVLIIRKITAYKSFIRYIKAGRRLVKNHDTSMLFSYSCEKIGIKTPPKLYTNKLISSPMLVGIIKPFIVIPDSEISEEHLQYIFLHELTHLKKLDIVYKWLVQLMVCIHWYNPIVYLVSREINRSCEFSCDESVLALLQGKNKKVYGDTLISSLEMSGAYTSQIISMTLCEDAAMLRSRLKAIASYASKSKSTILLSITLSIMFIFSSLWFGIYPVSGLQKESSLILNQTITRGNVDVCALEIMQRTGNWRYVEPLFPYMTSTGIEKVVKLYIQKTGNYEQVKPTTHYINRAENKKNLQPSQLIDKTYTTLAYELIEKTNDLYSSIVIFEFMDKKEIDSLVIHYMGRTNEIYKLYDVYTYMSTNAIDRVILDYIEKTGDTNSVKGMIPFMSSKASEEIFK